MDSVLVAVAVLLVPPPLIALISWLGTRLPAMGGYRVHTATKLVLLAMSDSRSTSEYRSAAPEVNASAGFIRRTITTMADGRFAERWPHDAFQHPGERRVVSDSSWRERHPWPGEYALQGRPGYSAPRRSPRGTSPIPIAIAVIVAVSCYIAVKVLTDLSNTLAILISAGIVAVYVVIRLTMSVARGVKLGYLGQPTGSEADGQPSAVYGHFGETMTGRDLLFTNTGSSDSSIKAINVAPVAVAEHGLWFSELTEDYLDLQSQAITDRGVSVKRIFVTGSMSKVQLQQLADVVWQLRNIGADVRTVSLDDVPNALAPLLHDFYVFDDEAVYDPVPAEPPPDRQQPPPYADRVDRDPATVRARSDLFEELWTRSRGVP